MERRTLSEIEPTVLAYIAGLVDGEGTITIRRSNQGRRDGRWETYAAHISAAQKDPMILNWLKETLGCGYVALGSPRRSGVVDVNGQSDPIPEDRRPSIWHVEYNMAYEVVKAILPYLLIKRRQGELVVEFQELKNANPHRSICRPKGQKGASPTPNWLMEKYRDYCERVQAMNHPPGWTRKAQPGPKFTGEVNGRHLPLLKP